MHVMVLGSGVIGVTTAYYLAQAGYKVTVVDRQSGPGLETSYANAGQISPGYATPWAAPGIPLKAMKWMLQRHAPLAIRPDGTLFQAAWMFQMLKNCNATSYARNKERMVRLAEYSRDCLRELRAKTGIAYEGRQQGTLQLFRTPRQLDDAVKDIDVLKRAGVAYELLQRDELATAEPALAHVKNKLTGGLRLPNDETGDCHVFTTKLEAMAIDLGVEFHYGMPISGLVTDLNSVRGVMSEGRLLQADAYVVALGSYSRSFLRSLVPIPVYPLKGYSITIPISDATRAPVSTILDETYKIAITRFEQRIRVGGMAEIAGFNRTLNPRRRETLEMVVNDLFPGCGSTASASFWTGLRPMTPDGTPIVGRTRLDNLYLNTGHGTLGWTMACGSAALLRDIISQRKPAIAHEDLAVGRYQSEGGLPRVRYA